jgi:hypothetical protein
MRTPAPAPIEKLDQSTGNHQLAGAAGDSPRAGREMPAGWQHRRCPSRDRRQAERGPGQQCGNPGAALTVADDCGLRRGGDERDCRMSPPPWRSAAGRSRGCLQVSVTTRSGGRMTRLS